ncbi:hypothetical protein D3C85_1835520 [compost metagenome]
MRALGAISSRISLINLNVWASMPLVRLTSSLPLNSSVYGTNTERKALEGSATKHRSQASSVACRSVTGSTAGRILMPLR